MNELLITLTSSIFWGGTGATITLEQPTGHVATVHCQNELTQGTSTTTGEITIGGITVEVRVVHMPGDQPDKFEVYPPEGYIAVPRYLNVNEGDTGEIRIFELDGIPLG